MLHWAGPLRRYSTTKPVLDQKRHYGYSRCSCMVWDSRLRLLRGLVNVLTLLYAHLQHALLGLESSIRTTSNTLHSLKLAPPTTCPECGAYSSPFSPPSYPSPSRTSHSHPQQQAVQYRLAPLRSRGQTQEMHRQYRCCRPTSSFS